MTFIPNKEAPLNVARAFSERFDFGIITVDQLDTWIIDQRLAEDPETEDPKDPRFREFRLARNKAMNLLNRHGGDCDDGFRFQLKVIEAGKRYQVVPYAAAALSDSLDFGPEMIKKLHAKSDKLLRAERLMIERAMMGGGDTDELMEAQRVMSLVNSQTEKTVRDARALMHKRNRDMDAAAEMIERLMLKYEADDSPVA